MAHIDTTGLLCYFETMAEDKVLLYRKWLAVQSNEVINFIQTELHIRDWQQCFWATDWQAAFEALPGLQGAKRRALIKEAMGLEDTIIAVPIKETDDDGGAWG